MITHTIDSYWIPSKQNIVKVKVTNLKNWPKLHNVWILKTTLHATHLLKLLDKMDKYEMDLASIVEDTELPQFCQQMSRQTRWNQYTLLKCGWVGEWTGGGYKKHHISIRTGILIYHWNRCTLFKEINLSENRLSVVSRIWSIFNEMLMPQLNIQYIPRNMHTVFALLCFVVVIHWLIFPYPSGLLHWHCGNLTIAPVPAKQPWWIWINTSCEFIMNDCITTTKQSTTKPCAYFLGYTVQPFFSTCWTDNQESWLH